MGGFVAFSTIVLSWFEYWYRNMKLCAMTLLIRFSALGFPFDVVQKTEYSGGLQRGSPLQQYGFCMSAMSTLLSWELSASCAIAAFQWCVVFWAIVSDSILVFCLAYNYRFNPAQPGALPAKDNVVCVCFPAFVMYMCVCFCAVGASYLVFFSNLLRWWSPAQNERFAWFWQNRAVCP